MRNKLSILILLLIMYSCTDNFTEKEVLGTYTPVDYNNCYDTIQIKENGLYHRKVYDKNQMLVLEMDGRWSFYDEDNNAIQFRSYFLNLDRDLVKYPELVKDTTGGGAFNLERLNGKIVFCTGYYSADLPNQNCYQKQ